MCKKPKTGMIVIGQIIIDVFEGESFPHSCLYNSMFTSTKVVGESVYVVCGGT